MIMTEAVRPTSQLIEDYITIEEAMQRSGYTGQYLRRMAREGKLRALKWGSMWMIHLASLQEYMQRAGSMGDGRYGPRRVDA